MFKIITLYYLNRILRKIFVLIMNLYIHLKEIFIKV